MPIIDYDLDAAEPYFLMPLAEKNYEAQIQEDKKNRTVTPEPLADILNALEELHALGFVHRDLKPKNVLLHDNKWKLSDFGLVLPSTGQTTRLTSTDSVWGTERYCAPEQIQDFRSVGPGVDIYAFGCVLHDLFSDEMRIPFQRYTCSGPIGIIIEKCTETSPKKRIRSVSTLREILFSTLSQSTALRPSAKAAEWAVLLASIPSWNEPQFDEFVRYLRQPDEEGDRWALLHGLAEEHVGALFPLSPELWHDFALIYCDWAHGGFEWAFCDVVVRRLECIFRLGSVDCKAAAAMAAASLGNSHNRWYVMQRLFLMCGPSLDAKVAQRIAIDITVEEAHQDFLRCASGIGYSVSDFHPAIASVLTKNSA